MGLNDLLRRDRDAATLFSHLPQKAQETLLQKAGDINSLAALRDYTVNMVAENGPFYAARTVDGTCMEPELKAAWTMEHET